jgi:hypothetical protein
MGQNYSASSKLTDKSFRGMDTDNFNNYLINEKLTSSANDVDFDNPISKLDLLASIQALILCDKSYGNGWLKEIYDVYTAINRKNNPMIGEELYIINSISIEADPANNSSNKSIPLSSKGHYTLTKSGYTIFDRSYTDITFAPVGMKKLYPEGTNVIENNGIYFQTLFMNQSALSTGSDKYYVRYPVQPTKNPLSVTQSIQDNQGTWFLPLGGVNPNILNENNNVDDMKNIFLRQNTWLRILKYGLGFLSDLLPLKVITSTINLANEYEAVKIPINTSASDVARVDGQLNHALVTQPLVPIFKMWEANTNLGSFVTAEKDEFEGGTKWYTNFTKGTDGNSPIVTYHGAISLLSGSNYTLSSGTTIQNKTIYKGNTYVVWRGSENTVNNNSDLQADLVTDGQVIQPFFNNFNLYTNDIQWHHGFLSNMYSTAFGSPSPTQLPFLVNPNNRLVNTGHSLGGLLANLSTLRFKNIILDQIPVIRPPYTPISVITFGMPPTTNQAGVDWESRYFSQYVTKALGPLGYLRESQQFIGTNNNIFALNTVNPNNINDKTGVVTSMLNPYNQKGLAPFLDPKYNISIPSLTTSGLNLNLLIQPIITFINNGGILTLNPNTGFFNDVVINIKTNYIMPNVQVTIYDNKSQVVKDAYVIYNSTRTGYNIYDIRGNDITDTSTVVVIDDKGNYFNLGDSKSLNNATVTIVVNISAYNAALTSFNTLITGKNTSTFTPFNTANETIFETVDFQPIKLFIPQVDISLAKNPDATNKSPLLHANLLLDAEGFAEDNTVEFINWQGEADPASTKFLTESTNFNYAQLGSYREGVKEKQIPTLKSYLFGIFQPGSKIIYNNQSDKWRGYLDWVGRKIPFLTIVFHDPLCYLNSLMKVYSEYDN